MYKRVFRILISLVFVFFYAQLQAQDVDLAQTLVIDVRTQEEWQVAHLDDAKLIPWEGIVAETDKLGLDKKQAIALFCRSGNRAGKAMALLSAAGYSNVVNLGSLEQAAQALEKPITH